MISVALGKESVVVATSKAEISQLKVSIAPIPVEAQSTVSQTDTAVAVMTKDLTERTHEHEQNNCEISSGTKGVQQIMPHMHEAFYHYRYREMMWERRDGHWHGRWQWSEWGPKAPNVWRIHARSAIAVPQEILLWAIECLVGTPLSIARTRDKGTGWNPVEHVAGLGNLALVCRSWYALIAPSLYSKIEIRDKVYDSWTSVRKSIWQSGSKVTIRSTRPFMTSAKASRLALRAVCMTWENPQPSTTEIYHPSQADIWAHQHRSWTSIALLQLDGCRFLSSSDLLRLLSSFSALEQVFLSMVAVTHVATSTVRPGRPGLLRRISTSLCTPTNLPFLTRRWSWTRGPLGPLVHSHQGAPFRGLSPRDHQLIVWVNEQLATFSHDSSYHLDAMDNKGHTWVAWSRAKSSSIHVEFHTIHDGVRRSDAAHVRHILLRVQEWPILRNLRDIQSQLGEIFAHFTSLSSIVLETAAEIRADDPTAQRLVEALRLKVNTAVVRHRTCEEAHTVARQAMKGAPCSPHTGLLSPYWCLHEHLQGWDTWLTWKYIQSLPEGDWRGWDPCRSAASATPPVSG